MDWGLVTALNWTQHRGMVPVGRGCGENLGLVRRGSSYSDHRGSCICLLQSVRVFSEGLGFNGVRRLWLSGVIKWCNRCCRCIAFCWILLYCVRSRSMNGIMLSTLGSCLVTTLSVSHQTIKPSVSQSFKLNPQHGDVRQGGPVRPSVFLQA